MSVPLLKSAGTLRQISSIKAARVFPKAVVQAERTECLNPITLGIVENATVAANKFMGTTSMRRVLAPTPEHGFPFWTGNGPPTLPSSRTFFCYSHFWNQKKKNTPQVISWMSRTVSMVALVPQATGQLKTKQLGKGVGASQFRPRLGFGHKQDPLRR